MPELWMTTGAGSSRVRHDTCHSHVSVRLSWHSRQRCKVPRNFLSCHPLSTKKDSTLMLYSPFIDRGLLLLVVALAYGPAARAQSVPAVASAQEAAIEASIKDLSTQWSTAYRENDPSILERIWAPDFVYVEPSGHRFTKAEGIAALKKGGDKYTVTEASSIDVRVYGGGTVAVDIGDYKEAGRDKDGTPFERKSRFTNVWVLKNGAWQCVSGHASAIPMR